MCFIFAWLELNGRIKAFTLKLNLTIRHWMLVHGTEYSAYKIMRAYSIVARTRLELLAILLVLGSMVRTMNSIPDSV